MLRQFVGAVARPQFQVRWPVVRRSVVPVVDHLETRQRAASHSSHDQPMLHHVPVAASHHEEVHRAAHVSHARVVALRSLQGRPALPCRVRFARESLPRQFPAFCRPRPGVLRVGRQRPPAGLAVARTRARRMLRGRLRPCVPPLERHPALRARQRHPRRRVARARPSSRRGRSHLRSAGRRACLVANPLRPIRRRPPLAADQTRARLHGLALPRPGAAPRAERPHLARRPLERRQTGLACRALHAWEYCIDTRGRQQPNP